MRIRIAFALLATMGLLLGAGCGGDQEEAASGPSTAAAATKDGMIQSLRELLAAIESGDLDDGATYLHPFPDMKPEDMKQALPGFVEKREISGPGIDVLAAKGTFGPLTEVFAERGTSWAGKVGADVAQCYALSYEGAEVAALWDGQRFLFLRLDDVGKLE